MAEGLTSEEVKKAVDECNEAMQKIDAEIDGGIEALNVIDDLRAIAGELHKSWETSNGESTMIELNKVIDSLEKNTNSIINSVKSTKADKYEFSKTSATETSWT